MTDTDWDALAARVGETFVFHDPATGDPLFTAGLTGVDRDPAATTLDFTAEAAPAQATYLVSGAGLELFALFVVPRSPTTFDATITTPSTS